MKGFEFRVLGLGLRVQSLKLRVLGLGFMILRFRM